MHSGSPAAAGWRGDAAGVQDARDLAHRLAFQFGEDRAQFLGALPMRVVTFYVSDPDTPFLDPIH